MDQLSFSDAEHNQKRKVTCREQFLSDMNQAAPWARLVVLIVTYYPKAGNGRQPYPLEKMLRIHFAAMVQFE